MAVTSRSLRLKGHGTGLRLSISGDWSSDPMGGVTECCRALMALEKALGESIRQARSAGPWAEVWRALGATDSAASFDDVADAFCGQGQ